MKPMLCTGNKQQKPCLNAQITTTTQKRPLWASSLRAYEVKSLAIYCKAKQQNQIKYVTKCALFQNKTLMEQCTSNHDKNKNKLRQKNND
jgi:hypothetical protein